MDDPITKIAAPGIAGFIGIVLGWAGFKARLNRVEQDLKRGEGKFDKMEELLRKQGVCIARMDERTDLLLSEWRTWKTRNTS